MKEFALNRLQQGVEVIPGKKEEVAKLLEDLVQDEKNGVLQTRLQSDPTLIDKAAEAMRYCDRVSDFSRVNAFMNVLNEPLSNLGYWDWKIELNRLAIRSAVGQQNRSSEALWRWQLADTLHRKSKTRAQLEHVAPAWLRALKIHLEIKDNDDILFDQLSLANIKQELQQWHDAIIQYLQGVRDASRFANNYWMAALGRNYGILLDFFGEEKAKWLIHLAAGIYSKEIERSYQKGNLLRLFGDLTGHYFRKGKFTFCIPLYQKQLEIAQNTNNTELINNMYRELFDCYLQQQNEAACHGCFLENNRLNKQLGIPKNHGMAGKLAWLRGEYDGAIQDFLAALKENDLDEDEHHLWLGKAFLAQGNLEQATDYLNRALTHQHEQKNALAMAKVQSQLALLELKRCHTRQAATLLGTSLKTQQAFGVEISPEERKIEQDIRAQLLLEMGDADLFDRLVADAPVIDLKPDFLLEGLPVSRRGGDDKEMVLIADGPVFIGAGAMETLNEKELLERMEELVFPYRNHSGRYKIPPIDESFDPDAIPFLLENHPSMFEEEKQSIIQNLETDKDSSTINNLIQKLKKEYDAAHPKATQIYLYPYYVDRDLVSNREYRTFCEAKGHPHPDYWLEGQMPAGCEELPVVHVSLEDAKAYAAWAGKEIPTAQELEKAIRGEQGTRYPWGDVWEPQRVKLGDGSVREAFDVEYQALNATIPETGGMIRFKNLRFNLPVHPFQVDDKEFIELLQGSISLDVQEKQKITKKFLELSQFQVDELIRIFHEEKAKFKSLGKEHEDALNKTRKQHYLGLMLPELLTLYQQALTVSRGNVSPEGVRDLVGSVWQWSLTEQGSDFFVKGGSWFSRQPQETCLGWNEEALSPREKRMDVGFRCVKPIFSKKDIPEV
ncbi:MAG: SUMF1/EgtB/PvdO family nonheme iron enzyme [Magnetococcales bacterium]|nr:SUMF1/EgtB/PvdO family nonheme iron enzyme [Magnetococcales bacterium]